MNQNPSPVASVTRSKPSLAEFMGVPLVAVAAPGALLTGAVMIVNVLPRLGPGGRVVVPWSICALTAVSTSIWLPWIVCAPRLRRPSARVALLVFLLLSTYCLYFFGFAELLARAYRRGL